MHWIIAALVCAAWVVGTTWAALRLKNPPAAGALLFITGYAFLPVINIGGIPLKEILTAQMALILLLIALRQRQVQLPTPGWWDIPMGLWFALQIASEVANARPFGDALVAVTHQFLLWVVPYFIGRTILKDWPDFRPLCQLLVLTALLLAPLALYESFAQPWARPVHELLYGTPLVSPPAAHRLILDRWGPANFRPSLFFGGAQPEIAAAFFFMAAALAQAALLLARTGAPAKRTRDIAALILLLALVFNARVYAAFILLAVGGIALWSAGFFRARWVLLALLAALPAYIAVREGGIFQTPFLVNGQYADPVGKNYSLWFRWYQEDMVRQYIQGAPALGYGSRVKLIWMNTGFYKLEFIDAYWAWLLLRTGWLGLIVALQATLIPLGAALWALPAQRLRLAAIAPAGAILTLLLLHLMDWSMNANLNPVWAFALGGAATMAFRPAIEILGRAR